MKKYIAIILCLALLLAACGKQPARPKPRVEETGPETRVSQYIQDLSAKKMEGRRVGTRGESRAALYLSRFFQKAGLQPLGDANTYFQSFHISNYEPVLVDGRMTFRAASGGKLTGENVLGLLPGREKGYIFVTAHYDHLGIINGELYPGANDNASGVAAVMELINQLKGQKPRYNIVFAFWSAEEEGLLGSDYYCHNPTVPLEETLAIINLDSIGYLQADKVITGWTALENETSRVILDRLQQEGWQITWEKTDKHSSDHASFNKRNVAGFTLLAPTWLDNNHTPGDIPDRVKIEPILELVTAIRKALLA